MMLERLDIDACVRGIIDLAGRDGVDLTAEVAADGSIWIGRIDRTHGAPGSGRRSIERLFEIADEEEIDVRLACEEDAGDLVAYYESLGFEIDAAGTSDDRGREGHVVMTRHPE